MGYEITIKQIKDRLLELHFREDAMNKEMGKLHKVILDAQKAKNKLALRISKNMKYRNVLINKL